MDVAPPFGSRVVVPSCAGEVVWCHVGDEACGAVRLREGYQSFKRSGTAVAYCREGEIGPAVGPDGMILGGALAVVALGIGVYAWRRGRRR